MNKSVINFLIIAALVASAAITSCNKDDDKGGGSAITKITAKFDDGAQYDGKIDKVKLTIWDVDTQKDVEIASGDWSNGGFTIDLSNVVPTKYLSPVDWEFSSSLNISNVDAKICIADDIIGYKDGKEVASFSYYKGAKDSENLAIYVYADSDVSISGSYTEEDGRYYYTDKHYVKLKKGWNVAYYGYVYDGNVRNGILTSDEISGLKWTIYK